MTSLRTVTFDPIPGGLPLTGLEMAPSQVCGAVRLVPLLRAAGAGADLRLAIRRYRERPLLVSLDGADPGGPGLNYQSYIPHGFVLSWRNDGDPVDAAYGTQFTPAEDERRIPTRGMRTASLLHRMVKREGSGRLRLLPMDLAMEGYLGLHFGGPTIAWTEYSRRALREGLSPRWERTISGRQIAGLEDALRVFEIHTRQTGVLVFVADELASAFVVANAEDYRALHETLLDDFYGQLIAQYALLYDDAVALRVSADDDGVVDMASLRRAIDGVRRTWREFHGLQAGSLVDRQISGHCVYRAGAFRLERFMTDLDPAGENHLGERIIRESDGELMYLKTYRLSRAQVTRAMLLEALAAHDWHLEATAAAVGTDRNGLALRLEQAGFGYLLVPDVLDAARSEDWHLRTGTPRRRR
jgi:hypothetical protein